MSDSADPAAWLRFAAENAEAARVLLETDWFNPSLQNAQQAIEKAMKAVILSRNLTVKRSHNIRELARDLRQAGVEVELNDDECDLIDSIYLPSKYPPVSALPDAAPDRNLCTRCVEIARRTCAWAQRLVPAP
jgi:HEPN domain-containing protein